MVHTTIWMKIYGIMLTQEKISNGTYCVVSFIQHSEIETILVVAVWGRHGREMGALTKQQWKEFLWWDVLYLDCISVNNLVVITYHSFALHYQYRSWVKYTRDLSALFLTTTCESQNKNFNLKTWVFNYIYNSVTVAWFYSRFTAWRFCHMIRWSTFEKSVQWE